MSNVRASKVAPEEVLMAWAEQWAKEGVKVEWQKLLPPQGFPRFYPDVG